MIGLEGERDNAQRFKQGFAREAVVWISVMWRMNKAYIEPTPNDMNL
jgi:hypothetical protein